MKLETFFEKFDQFADAPDAVAKMRELVLELSATGRLIPESLERPVEEDTKLMGTIVELVMGQAPAGDEYNTEGRGTVFVKVGEFGPLYPREEVWTTNPLKFAKAGDVLVCVVGATVGKLNLAIDCAIGRSVAAIRPSSALDTKFLYYSLIPYTLRLRRNSRGSAQGVIGKAELNAVSLWVPCCAVQKRNVAKVDELMALCDRLEAQQQEREARHAALARASLARFADAPTPANLDFLFHKSYAIPPADLRKSILTLAVQGKLVPQDSDDESVTELLTRHLEARNTLVCRGKVRDEKSLEPIQPGDEASEIPSGWAWCKIDGLVHSMRSDIRTGPFGSSLHKHDHRPEGVPVWGIETIGKAGYFTGRNKIFVDAVKAQELKSFAVKSGDIIISRSGTVGELCRLPDGTQDGLISTNLMKISLNSEVISPDYFCLLFRGAISINTQLSELCFGSTRLFLTQKILAKLKFPVPPLAEQRRIVARVDQLMALVDELERQLAASRATAANLLEAVVAELTTQA